MIGSHRQSLANDERSSCATPTHWKRPLRRRIRGHHSYARRPVAGSRKFIDAQQEKKFPPTVAGARSAKIEPMKLEVLAADPAQPWYSDGLQFTCSQCGNCCTGGPGYVWISREEIVRLADHLQLSPETVVERYCRKIDGRFSLHERRVASGNFDCIFLKEQRIPGEKGAATQVRRTCEIYQVRPLQCRTWPFWTENLASEKNWNHAARRCHGMNRGRQFTVEQIHAVRDAEDWPDKPPTSAAPNNT